MFAVLAFLLQKRAGIDPTLPTMRLQQRYFYIQ